MLGLGFGLVKGKGKVQAEYHEKALRFSKYIKDPSLGMSWALAAEKHTGWNTHDASRLIIVAPMR